MLCWSCQQEIAATAEFCPHCEAPVEQEPTAEEKAAVELALAGLSPDVIEELREAFEKSATGEEFVNRIMIGDCPACGSSATGDCENDPDIDDATIARCFECGQFWCPDCGELFQRNQLDNHDCPAWDDLDIDLDDLDGDVTQ